MREKARLFLAVVFTLLVAGGCGAGNNVYMEKVTEEAAGTETEEQDVAEQKQESCYVYVCGAVLVPGVYEIPADGRVYEAVKAAGGLAEGACAEAINQAERVSDGQMIRIPTEEEVSEWDRRKEADEDGRMDINHASVADFMTLPGIGASKAEALVSYREAKGGFSSIEDIMNVDGIKKGVFDKIKDRIKVN